MRIAVPLILSLTIHAVASAQTTPAAAAPAMKPGLWETTQVIDKPAMASKRTVTSQTCLSADDVKTVSRILPVQHEAPMKCQNRDVKVGKDGAVEWRIVCTGAGAAMSGTGRMQAAGETFTAQASLSPKSGKNGKAEQTISGKWLSDCK